MSLDKVWTPEDLRGTLGMFEMEIAAAKIMNLRERVPEFAEMLAVPKGAVCLSDMDKGTQEAGFLHLLCGGWLRPASVCSKLYFVPREAFWERLRQKGKI